ncbi:UV DNA damage repair endonuclease UvsE [Desulfosarcina ovata]|uniref:UV DNA damage endonuclease n=1 Tax=Desulfosarcina ovata subsp. ovata TaxID=2752305 RepID=A0A5K8AD78_9BACT|nr:UV DNA damage repair endonuclease UvsE [Desulfosarcina ovata]BBO89944.1 UV DNA damage endonuclease [Desulfosarcina ovata subsp. ovata]
MIRLGLCCIFRKAPIKFRRTTAKHLLLLDRGDQRRRLASICMHNADALYRALEFCHARGIGAFRINSQILPLKTHPQAGYTLQELPGGDDIIARFKQCGHFVRHNGLRTSFHPDQFIVLTSPDSGVVERSLADLAYHAEVAEWVAADVINIHGGGGYGEKPAALERLTRVIEGLPPAIRSRLTLENDDRVYTPADLLPVCRATGIPLVYDLHHHRCLPDGEGVETTTAAALATWDREPLMHLSSPLNGWQQPPFRPHHDYIDPADFPDCWRDLDLTLEVEAKAKELAVLKLRRWMADAGIAFAGR